MTGDRGYAWDPTFRLPQSAFRNWQRPLGASLLIVLLASCARPPVRPANVGGAEVGLASWYGSDFHGRRTSSGEVYEDRKSVV